MFIQHSWFTALNVALKEHEEIMKSRFLSTASDDHLDSLVIIALHKYILKKAYIERIIDITL